MSPSVGIGSPAITYSGMRNCLLKIWADSEPQLLSSSAIFFDGQKITGAAAPATSGRNQEITSVPSRRII
jgi:hypothetical protein